MQSIDYKVEQRQINMVAHPANNLKAAPLVS